MGLIIGMMMGALVGIVLVAGWSRMIRYRSTNRITKAVDIKLLGSLKRDDLNKIFGDSIPKWISFPAFEQVKWLNKLLSKLWPFIAEAATVVIKESVEPVLDDYRPAGISSIKFSKLFLGNVSPKIEGIRVQSLKKGQITMDIDLKWGGDPSIILAVEALVASLPIQLKNLQVFTVIRVIFQLSEDIPCISAVVIALLSEPKPRIDYTLKAVGGSLTAIPGLSDMIDDTVNSIISDQLQWPHRILVPLAVGVDTSELELKPQGKLTITIVKASALKNFEMMGKSDPYVVLYIRPLFKIKTKVIDNNLNPVWDETSELIVEDKETQSVVFEVYDEDHVQQDRKLGVAQLALIGLENDTTKEFDLKLQPALDMMKIKDKKDRGILNIKITYHPFTKEEQLEALEAEKIIAEERRKLKEAGVIGSMMDALGGAASFVGSGVGLVGTGLGAGAGLVGSGLGAVGSDFSKAGKFMGKSVTGGPRSKSPGAGNANGS